MPRALKCQYTDPQLPGTEGKGADKPGLEVYVQKRGGVTVWLFRKISALKGH